MIARAPRPAKAPSFPKSPAPAMPKNAEDNRQARWEASRASLGFSYPEFICYEWLTLRKKLKPYVDFFPQYGVSGGRTFLGGAVIDFHFPILRIDWFVQGLRFHFKTPVQRGRDIIEKLQSAQRGFIPVELFEDDIIQRTESTLSQALKGIQVSRRGTR